MNKVKIEGVAEFDCITAISNRSFIDGKMRDVITFKLTNTTVDLVKESFTTVSTYALLESRMEQEVQTISKFDPLDPTRYIDTEEIVDVEKYTPYDKSEYRVLGDIILHPDGNISVNMGKKTEEELTIEKMDMDNAAVLYEILTGEELK